MTALKILNGKFANQFENYVGEDQMWMLDNIIEAMEDYAAQKPPKLLQLRDNSGNDAGIVSTFNTEETKDSWVINR